MPNDAYEQYPNEKSLYLSRHTFFCLNVKNYLPREREGLKEGLDKENKLSECPKYIKELNN